MFLHAQDLHGLEPGRGVRGLDQDWPNRTRACSTSCRAGGPGPGSSPPRAGAGRSPSGSRACSAGPSARRPGVLLNEGPHRTDALQTDPATLAPPNPHRTTRPRSIDHLDHHPAMTGGDDPAAGASGHWIAGLHLEHQPGPGLRDCHQMKAREVQENVASLAAIEPSEQAHVELGIVEVLEISGGRSPLIIEDLDVYPQLPRITGAPTLNSEEPPMQAQTGR